MNSFDLLRFKADIPNKFREDSVAIICLFSSKQIHHPGDERSRTHPGHGYPEHTEIRYTSDIYAFPTIPLYREALVLLYGETPNRKDIIAYELGNRTNVNIKLDIV